MSDITTVRIYGASDDLVEIETSNKTGEEYNLVSSEHWQAVIEDPQGNKAQLYVDLRRNGTWTATYGQVDEDEDLPGWANRTYFDRSIINYAAILELQVPAGTTITPDNGNDEEPTFTI